MLRNLALEWYHVIVLLFASIAAAQDCRLTIGRNGETPKPAFELNGRPFYPIIYTDHFARFSPRLLSQLREQGFNALQIALDTEESGSSRLRGLLSRCAAIKLPVIVEMHAWSTRAILIGRLELNMVMSDGQPVKYFPDYANPLMREEYLKRYARATVDLREFVDKPIVAISVGAYDAYHLPDGETHADFVVPAHSQAHQTRVPFGKYVADAFRRSLVVARSEDDASEGALAVPGAGPPTDLDDAKSNEQWRRWLLFRRDLVTQWLAATVDTVREKSGLPVGVSFDLNFAQREQFATPPFAWTQIVDFASVYCYGNRSDARYVPRLLRTVWREFSDAGVPMIGLLEFSSGLSGETAGDAYARECAPFVSGLMTAGPSPDKKHGADRVAAFARWATDVGANRLLESFPTAADVLLVVNRHSTEQSYPELQWCESADQPCDVIYVDDDWNGGGSSNYRCVVVDPNLRLPSSSPGGIGTRYIRSEDLADYLSGRTGTP